MARKILALNVAFFMFAALPCVAWSIQPERQQAPARERDAEERDRDREGGRPVPEDQQARGQGTEEGMPERGREPAIRGAPRFVQPRWRLGVYANNTSTGVVITRVIRQTPAWQAGLESGDRIVTVDGYQVGYVGDRAYYLGEELQRRAGPRGEVRLLVQNVRNRQLLNVDVRLESQRDRDPRDRPFRGRGREQGDRRQPREER